MASCTRLHLLPKPITNGPQVNLLSSFIHACFQSESFCPKLLDYTRAYSRPAG